MSTRITIRFAVLLILLTPVVHAEKLALRNINIIDVENLKLIENQTVVIENTIITSVIDRQNPRMGKDVVVLDMTDKYLIPGLIDTHVHHATSPDDSDNDKITRKRLRELLRGGVTSVRDMGGDARVLSSLQRRANADVIQSPDIYYSAIIGGREFFNDPRTIASAKGRVPGNVDWMRAVDATTDFDTLMQRTLGTGATGIKIYANVPADVIQQLRLAADRHGLKVWSHVFVGPAKPLDVVTAGVGTVSHASDLAAHVVDDFFAFRRQDKQLSTNQFRQSQDPERYNNLIAAMKDQGTILDPTLTVFEQNQIARGDKGKMLYTWGTKLTRLANENGVKISTGTDATSDGSGLPYPMVHHEMELLVRDAGLSELQAIQSATLIGAEVIGIEDESGSIKPGNKANLVILNANPVESIANTRDIAHVIKNGEFIHRGDLPGLPFSNARPAGGMLWMSGQIGNIPSTAVLAGDSIEVQMTRAMKNFGPVLQEYDLTFEDIVKCTLFLDDIKDWPAANAAYRPFFQQYPARSAFATDGLALGAKVEIECIAEL